MQQTNPVGPPGGGQMHPYSRHPEFNFYTPRKKRKYEYKGLIIRLMVLFLLFLLGAGGTIVYKVQKVKVKVAGLSAENQKPESFFESATSLVVQKRKDLRGDQRERINVLLLGMGGEGHSGELLTDTIMLASINPKTYQSALLSIPRDLYVRISQQNVSTKINAVYAYGIYSQQSPSDSLQNLKNVITEITGQPIDYHVVMDFHGFEQIIDRLEGIDVQVEQDIKDERYPGPNFSYETFEIEKGTHHLDGATALKYARVRHVEGGDFGRAGRQQQILAAVKRKAFSIETMTNPSTLADLMDLLGDHLKTDIQLSEIPSFLELSQNVNVHQTTNKVLDAWNPDSLLASSHKPLGGVSAYVLIPRAKNFSQIKELSDNIFDLDLIERKKLLLGQEKSTLAVMTETPTKPSRISAIFNRFGYKNVSILPKTDGITCSGKSILYNNAPAPKIYTLDDLVTKLEASVIDRKFENISQDIVICLSGDISSYFENQNETAEEEQSTLKDQSIIDAKGQVRVNKGM